MTIARATHVKRATVMGVMLIAAAAHDRLPQRSIGVFVGLALTIVLAAYGFYVIRTLRVEGASPASITRVLMAGIVPRPGRLWSQSIARVTSLRKRSHD